MMNKENSTETVKIETPSVSENVIQAFKAIDKFDVDKLQKLFDEGLLPNSVNKKGVPLLHYAVKLLNPKMVEVILNNRADPNLRNNVEENAVFRGLDALGIKKEIKISGATPLISALNLPIPKGFEKIYGDTADLMLDMLLTAGAKVNMREENAGLTALHFAANKCDENLIKRLIESGADINVKAFMNNYHDFENPADIALTPLLLSVISDKNPQETTHCIDYMVKNGANVDEYALNSVVYMIILMELAQSNIDKTREILLRRINLDFAKMDSDRVSKNLDMFINSKPQYNSHYENCVRNLLDQNVTLNNKVDQLVYLGHLNSWQGEISSSYSSRLSGETANMHRTKGVEGWTIEKQIPMKLTNLLYVLKGVQDPQFDCVAKFGESRERITAKIKDEIASQVSVFFTGRLIDYSTFLKYLISKKMEKDNDFSDSKWFFEDLNKTYDKALLEKMAERIGNLKQGQKFSVSFFTKDHATFSDYVKQIDGKLTRNNYNLGAGIEEHPVSLDNKVYPHSIVNIPVEPFANKTNSALAHLYSFIMARGNSAYEIPGKIHPAFKNAYDSVLKLGGEMPKNVNELIPMKYQVVGNCSVKNNNFALRNRLQNDKLYKFIKNYEIMMLKQQLNVDNRLVYAKEIEKDVANLSIIVSGKIYPQLAEKQLYRFFAKRAEVVPENILKVPGDRLAYVIEKALNSGLNEAYFASCLKIFDVIEKIAEHYKSDKLQAVLKSFSTGYEVQGLASKNTMIRRNLFKQFSQIPSEGRTNVGAKKDEATPMEIDVIETNHIGGKRKAEINDLRASFYKKRDLEKNSREM